MKNENENFDENENVHDEDFFDPNTEAAFIMTSEDRILGVIKNNPDLFDPENSTQITEKLLGLGRKLFHDGANYVLSDLKGSLMEVIDENE